MIELTRGLGDKSATNLTNIVMNNCELIREFTFSILFGCFFINSMCSQICSSYSCEQVT